VYWVPLTPGQPDGIDHTSIAYEDKLLLKLRIERLGSPRAYSQQPPSRCTHVLQQPEIESCDAAAGTWVTRSAFVYVEARAEDQFMLAGTVHHTWVWRDGRLQILCKRVDLINCDAALPSIQLFP
jgi:3-phenylpropionate/cinnamic acid dioxygenase small subunit